MISLSFCVSLLVTCAAKPNFVFILADDLDNDFKQDRLVFMPNLKKIADTGSHFVNHAAVQPVCGPSRSSFLVGRYPHNTGYVCNKDQPSIDNFKKLMNNTIGTWFTNAGYWTSFVGKYVNGLEKFVPSGWNSWQAFSSSAGTYNYYNATPWNVTFNDAGTEPITPLKWHAMTGIHQSDFVGQFGVEQMKVAIKKGKPFFVSLTATMVHEGTCYGPFTDESMYADTDPYWEKNLVRWGCDPNVKGECAFTASPCPSDANKEAFVGKKNPHVGDFNQTNTGPLPEPMDLSPITDFQSKRMDIGFRNRSSALLDLDKMIGVVLDGLDKLGVADNTYIIFTSDNGFHLGEHRMLLGKEHPYQTDVSLPMYMKGPSVPQGKELLYPTTHIDITATLVELASLKIMGPKLDGLSFASAFFSNPPQPEAWREFQFSEHHCDKLTWRKIRRPLSNITYNMWCDAKNSVGIEEVYDLGNDPWELDNIVNKAGVGKNFSATEGPLAEFLWTCAGAECNSPTAKKVQHFECYTVSLGEDASEDSD